MIVPFQMVMFPLTKVANLLHLDNPLGILVLYLGFGSAQSVFLFSGFVKSVPIAVEEAAVIDGASPFTTLRKITIPLVMPSITITLFMTIANSFKMFDQNLALTAGAPGKETAMVALDIYNTFYSRVGWEGVGQAKALIFFLVVVLITLAQLSITRRREVTN
jgi:raffinose/stachyose/melibiose transport system permease protein